MARGLSRTHGIRRSKSQLRIVRGVNPSSIAASLTRSRFPACSVMLFCFLMFHPLDDNEYKCQSRSMKRHLHASKSNTSPPKKPPQSITPEKVALINLVERMNARDDWWAQTLVMLRASELTRDVLRGLAEVDLSRIGRCPVCGKFFAKLRRDQKACPKLVSGCANLLRVNRWREKYPESYKLTRIQRAEMDGSQK
jgi:hypothetical protein